MQSNIPFICHLLRRGLQISLKEKEILKNRKRSHSEIFNTSYHQKSSMTALRECFLIALCISPLPLEGLPIPPKQVLETDLVGQLQHLVSLKSPPRETASDNFQAVSPQMKSDFGIIRKSSKRAVFDLIPYRPRGEEQRSFDSTRRFFKPNDSRRTIKMTSHLKVKNLIKKILRKYALVEKIRSNRGARFVRDLEKSQRHDALKPRQ